MDPHKVYVTMNLLSGCATSENKDILLHKDVMEGLARVKEEFKALTNENDPKAKQKSEEVLFR